jgi:hypothetical protein
MVSSFIEYNKFRADSRSPGQAQGTLSLEVLLERRERASARPLLRGPSTPLAAAGRRDWRAALFHHASKPDADQKR